MDHNKYMDQALDQAQSALHLGEFPVGCILVHQETIVATGARSGTKGPDSGPKNEIDHAEIIALRHFYQLDMLINPAKMRIYCTMEPCLMCFAAILLAGIGTIVYAYEDVMGGGARLDLQHLTPLYRSMKPTIIPNIRRKESLALFKTFFNNGQNAYWKDSYLAQYTLEQT